MKDNLTDLFGSRFSGHEAPVDPGTWEAISSGLGVATGETLRQALQQKFTGHEVNVDPGVWDGISNQLGHGAGAGAGTGIGAGWMAAGIGALVLTGGLLWYGSSGPAEEVAQQPVPEQQVAQVPVNKEVMPVVGEVAEEPNTTITADVQQNIATPAETAPAPKDRVGTAKSTEPGTRPAEVERPGPGLSTVNAVLQAEIDHAVAEPKAPQAKEPIPAPSGSEMPREEIAPPQSDTPAQPEVIGDMNMADDPSVEQAIPSEFKIHIPNVFSPNNDNVNDVLEVQVSGSVRKVLVKIFSAKSGALVFTSTDLETSWNGLDLRGALCEEGFYFYAIELVGEDGLTHTDGETVRLYRQ